MASPTIEAVAEYAVANGSTHALPLPSGIVDGSFVEAFFVVKDSGFTVAWPAGWTELFQYEAATDVTCVYAYHRATGSESGTITVTLGSTKKAGAILQRLSGESGDTAPEASLGATGANTNPDPDQITVGDSKDYLFTAFHGISSAPATTGYPTDYDLSQNEVSGGGSIGIGMAVASRALTTGADQNPGTFTVADSEEWGALTILRHPAAVGGQTIAVGTLPETDALIPVVPVKPIIVGVGTLAETDSLISTQARKVAPVGVLAEVDSLLPVQARKLADIGVLGEVDSLIPVEAVKPIIKEVGALGESDTLNPVQARKIANIGTLVEVEALLAIAGIKTAQIGTLGETESLIPVEVVQPGEQIIAVTTLAEIEALIPTQARKVAGVGVLTETDVLNPIQARKIADVGMIAELDSLLTILAEKPIVQTVGTLAEIDALLPVSGVKIVQVGMIAELESLLAIQPRKIAGIGTLVELDVLVAIVVIGGLVQIHPDAPLFAVLVSAPALAELTERGFSVADLVGTGSVADLDETKTSA